MRTCSYALLTQSRGRFSHSCFKGCLTFSKQSRDFQKNKVHLLHAPRGYTCRQSLSVKVVPVGPKKSKPWLGDTAVPCDTSEVFEEKSYFRVRWTQATIRFKAFIVKMFYKTHPLLRAIENRWTIKNAYAGKIKSLEKGSFISYSP